MVQTGDPSGTGKGGTSIWGRKFEDQFNETLKVQRLAGWLGRGLLLETGWLVGERVVLAWGSWRKLQVCPLESKAVGRLVFYIEAIIKPADFP